MQITPLYSGHTGYGSTTLNLISRTQDLIEEVVNFRTNVRDFSAPRMQLSSSLPAAPLADTQPVVDVSI